jgi:ABC-type phosphate transport system permease subunit
VHLINVILFKQLSLQYNPINLVILTLKKSDKLDKFKSCTLIQSTLIILIMQSWMKISLILCSFGFFREFRPSEPFVTEFLAGEWRNVTKDQLNFEVYPIGTYSALALLVIVFLITDFLR